MAEEDIDQVVKNEQDETNAEMKGGEEARGTRRPTKPRYNVRIEELAKPKKWLMLGTWRDFHAVFDPERMQRFKERVQEEFSMSPEETELYFSQLRKQVRKMRSKRAIEKQLRREQAIAKQEAYALFRKRLRRALRYAFEHRPPAIVSPMLRDLSDNILEKLAVLHRVQVPNRDSTDKNSVFLVCVADWAAKFISNIYYEVDACERADVARLGRDVSSKVSVCPSSVGEEAEAEEEEEEDEEEEGEDEEEEPEEEEEEEEKFHKTAIEEEAEQAKISAAEETGEVKKEREERLEIVTAEEEEETAVVGTFE